MFGPYILLDRDWVITYHIWLALSQNRRKGFREIPKEEKTQNLLEVVIQRDTVVVGA